MVALTSWAGCSCCMVLIIRSSRIVKVWSLLFKLWISLWAFALRSRANGFIFVG